MKRYWSKKAAALSPYTAGEQPAEKLIKLNTNENAYPPSPAVARAIAEAAASLRLYPQPNADALRQAIAEHHGLGVDNVFCANGSDEALALCYLAFFDPGRPVRTLDVTYSFYSVWARLFDIILDIVPLKDDFTVDVPAICGGGNVLIANPNAPTGIALPLDGVERIVQNTDGAVIVDEAYVDFGGQSADALIGRYPNLAVVRTLSKGYSLAGLRTGYVLADESLIGALFAVKDSFNSYPLGIPAQAGAAAALGDTAYHDETVRKIVETREFTMQGLARLGLDALPSSANFIFVKCANAARVFRQLRQRGILVRHFDAERIRDYLRVTIGTPGQMQAFLDAMGEIL